MWIKKLQREIYQKKFIWPLCPSQSDNNMAMVELLSKIFPYYWRASKEYNSFICIRINLKLQFLTGSLSGIEFL